MKRTSYPHRRRSHRCTVYPNEASRQYRIHKTLDYLLTALTSMGVVTILVFLTTLL